MKTVASETREMVKTGKQSKKNTRQNPNVLRASAGDFALMRDDRVPPTGVEPVACALGKRRSILLSYEGKLSEYTQFLTRTPAKFF